MSDSDECEIPLQDQRTYGAGIKRKRVKFVPSSSLDSSVTATSGRTSGQSVRDRYLGIVLAKQIPGARATEPSDMQTIRATDTEPACIDKSGDPQAQVCDVCHLPFPAEQAHEAPPKESGSSSDLSETLNTKPHEASLAHQVCLTHSHPPSHLERNRKGLSYLSAYGWDPDLRLGLGASGQGIRFPIKAKAKEDKLGIGVVAPSSEELESVKAKRRKEKHRRQGLDAKKVRKMQDSDKKKGERLKQLFYANDDVERYLGGGN